DGRSHRQDRRNTAARAGAVGAHQRLDLRLRQHAGVELQLVDGTRHRQRAVGGERVGFPADLHGVAGIGGVEVGGVHQVCHTVNVNLLDAAVVHVGDEVPVAVGDARVAAEPVAAVLHGTGDGTGTGVVRIAEVEDGVACHPAAACVLGED